jgi:hypothetical protein
LGVLYCELLYSKINENVNFFTPKLMKIRSSSLFFGSFGHHFQIKLSIHDSKLQHCGPCKISWKKSKTLYLDSSGHIEGGIMQNQ